MKKNKMEIIKNMKDKNPKKFLFVLCISLGIVVCLIVVLLFCFYPKIRMNKLLKDMGKDYYENYYYIQLDDNKKVRKDFLEKFSNEGLKINLNTISIYDDSKINKFKNCDKDNSVVIVYPKEPYNYNSYKIKVKLDCK